MGDVTSFRTVAVGEFDHGFDCMDCGRDLSAVGSPYGSRLDSFTSDGCPVVDLVCVYCAIGRSDG